MTQTNRGVKIFSKHYKPGEASSGTSSCEHCGRSEAESIGLRTDSSGTKSFCSINCAMSAATDDKASVWREILRQRTQLIRQIEMARGSKVITLIHREDMHDGREQYLTIDDSEDILHQVRSTPAEKPIDLIIHCPGGVVLPAEQIAFALCERGGKVSAIIPHYAMSGATLICLAADEILMDPHSVLGPLDPQVGGFPAPSLLKILELKEPQFISDQVLILADIAGKSLAQMRSFITSLMRERMGMEAAKKLAEFLTGGYLTHDSPITAREAKLLGLPVTVGIPNDVHRFMRLHKLTGSTILQHHTTKSVGSHDDLNIESEVRMDLKRRCDE